MKVLSELTSANDQFRAFSQLGFQRLLFLSVASSSRDVETPYEVDHFSFLFLEDGVEFCFWVRKIIAPVPLLRLMMCIVSDDIGIGRLPAGGSVSQASRRHLLF